MSEDESTGSAGPADNALVALYRRYLGEPESETDVYVGFALFFGGIALALIGFLLFLWDVTLPRDSALFVQLREVSIALASLGLPAFVLSVVVLLPVRRRVVYAGTAGAVLCLVGVGVFVATFPGNWNVPGRADYSVHGISVYAAGMVALAASTGSALVADYLERARARAASGPGSAGGAEGVARSSADADETVTDEQVRRDIDEAMESAELTWGGVEKTESRRLTIDTTEDDVDYSGFDSAAANTVRSEGVDDAVAGLRRLQGGERETGTGEGVDEQTAALQALRERQEAEDDAGGDLLGRMRERLGL